MIEMICSLFGSCVVGLALSMRLNRLYFTRSTVHRWTVLEVAGAVVGLAACAGMVGEWFLPRLEAMRAETLLVSGLGVWVLGFTRGHLCELAARLEGWDGLTERRLSAGELLRQRHH